MSYSATEVTATAIPAIHPLVQRWLHDDQGVRFHVADRVFAGEYPAEMATLPALRFQFTGSVPDAEPTYAWWKFTGQIDCHADTQMSADALATSVLRALMRLEGTVHTEGVISGVSVWGVQTVSDGEWTPPKPERIVSVTLTARSN